MIITDTDFLSAFFKIDQLNLIFTAFQKEEIIITSAVLHKLEKAPFYPSFLELLSKEKRIKIQKINIKEKSETLGLGELTSITLAEQTKSILLTNDSLAVQTAEQKGITVLDIPTFLFHCKTRKLLTKEQLKTLIQDLKKNDYYEFSQEINKKLLE